MAHIITVLADGFEEIEAVTIIDLLRRAHIQVTILSLEKLEVCGSHDITAIADMLIADYHGHHDGIVLPGGMPGTKHLGESPRVLELIQETFRNGGLCAAICAAPSVLGKAGILKGRRASCYPGFEESLTGAQFSDKPVVRDGTVITSRGAGTAIPFALELISYLGGPDTASKIENAILFK